MSAIAKNYYLRCKKGLITNINDIRKYWRDEVVEYLEADNYVIEDDGTIVDMNP